MTDYLFRNRVSTGDLRLSKIINDFDYTDIETINTAVIRVRSRLTDAGLRGASADAKFGIVHSPTFGACVVFRDGVPHVEVNTAIPTILSLLNVCVLSFLDASDDEAGKAADRHAMIEDAVDVFLRLLDAPDRLGDLRFRRRWRPEGFLRSFGFPEESIKSAPFDLMRDHQLEFVLLHEIAHVAAESSANPGAGALTESKDPFEIEFEADRRAIIETRQLWAKELHTSFCEAMQLAAFLYLDVLEFLEAALKQTGRRMVSWIDIPWSTRRDTHPPALARFNSALAVVAPPTHFARLLLTSFEEMLARLKHGLVIGAVDGTPFFRLARIAAHERLRLWMAESGEYPSALTDRLVINDRDSEDLVLGRGANPSIWFANETSKNVEAKVLKIAKARPFAEALLERCGPITVAGLKEEIDRGLKLPQA
jgi:hypothetical protein